LVDTGASAANAAPTDIDFLRTAVTDADGVFRWLQVPHNSYYLTIEPSAGYVLRGEARKVVIVNEQFTPPILVPVLERLPGMTAHLPIMR
jgi:hypothetical protein